MQLGELTWALDEQLLVDKNPPICGSTLLLRYSLHRMLVQALEIGELQ